MKRTLPELKPAQNNRPGYGVLTLQGWEVTVLEAGAGFEVCVQRNQDSRFLGEGGDWTATQTWHQVDVADEGGEFVNLTLGPNIVDPLVANPQMAYQVQVRLGQELGRGVMRIREGVLSSHAAGQTGEAVAHVSSKVPTVQPLAPQPVEAEPPVPVSLLDTQPAKPSNSKLPLMLGLVALLLVLVGGFFGWTWYKNQTPAIQTAVTTPAANPPAPVAPPAPAPAPVVTSPAPAPVTTAPALAASPAGCTPESLAATKDDLQFIQSCLKTNPTSDQVLEVVAAAKAAKRCDVAQRLYVFKSNGGDIKVALAYAREYDSASFVAGCVTAADKETALYWYEFVLSKDPSNQVAKDRIKALRG